MKVKSIMNFELRILNWKLKPFNSKHSTFKIKSYLISFFIFILPLFAIPFTDNGDGTITDSTLGLVWQKCSMGQNNDSTCSGSITNVTWANAITYCNNLSLGGFGAGQWRLPNVNELLSITNPTSATYPSINTTMFPNTITSSYWSSTRYAQIGGYVWYVHFAGGYIAYRNSTSYDFVRCVH